MSPSDTTEPVAHRALVHGAGAAIVAMFSYATASRFPFVHEAYWAAVAAVVSLCPERAATINAGVQQLFGAAVGGLIGWASASWWRHEVLVYGAGVVIAVSLCYLLRLPSAARLAGVAVTITTLIPSSAPPAFVALHRFLEVSYGVACAMGYTLVIACIVTLWDRARLRRGERRSRLPPHVGAT